MVTVTERYQESLERAKSANLEGIIRKQAADSEPRVASRKQVERRRQALLRQLCNPVLVAQRLERILQGNDLSDIGYLARGIICARSVGRIVIRRDGSPIGYGTGFLVAPGVLLTNQHVLTTRQEVAESIVQFRYERDLRGNDVPPVEFQLSAEVEPIIDESLDMALVAVAPRAIAGAGEPALDQFGWLPLSPEPGKAFVGEYLTIIQHPNGERKQICVRENKLLKYADNGPFIWYQTDTVSGSSGSAVFNDNWQVVALHHSSVPRVNKKNQWLARNGQVWRPEMGDEQIDWIANEGVRVSQIVRFLQAEHAHNPLARAVLSVKEPPACELTISAEGAMGSEGLRVTSDRSGNTRIVLPIEIGLQVGLHEQIRAAADAVLRRRAAATDAGAASGTRPGSSGPRVVEAVVVDQSNYAKRNGFDTRFLGDGLVVPLPKVSGAKQKKDVLAVNGTGGQLKYWNYSVIVNRARRLAFFSAANVDPAQWRGARDADGDKWYRDTRVDKVDKAAQLGQEFYGSQKKFEADRSQNPFDRGHLTRRRDAQWGATDREAKRNGDESFHFTNCAPQHWQFNQNNAASGLWFRLEESAARTLSNGGRLCIINGPVFDAPLCTATADGRLRLNVKGKRVADGTFGSVKIPKQFFKVIAYNENGTLRAKAFVVTQEDLLATVDRFYEGKKKPTTLSDSEVRLYRVKISDLEKLTGLDFGSLTAADAPTTTEEAARVDDGMPIEDENDLWT